MTKLEKVNNISSIFSSNQNISAFPNGQGDDTKEGEDDTDDDD